MTPVIKTKYRINHTSNHQEHQGEKTRNPKLIIRTPKHCRQIHETIKKILHTDLYSHDRTYIGLLSIISPMNRPNIIAETIPPSVKTPLRLEWMEKNMFSPVMKNLLFSPFFMT
jgi:hypothetical protein